VVARGVHLADPNVDTGLRGLRHSLEGDRMTITWKGIVMDGAFFPKLSDKEKREYLLSLQAQLWASVDPNSGKLERFGSRDESYDYPARNQQALRAEKAFNVAAAHTIGMLQAIDTVNMDQGAKDIVSEIIIGHMALPLARTHGDQFDSFRFYAKCKGREE
jgi:hypothetical protein